MIDVIQSTPTDLFIVFKLLSKIKALLKKSRTIAQLNAKSKAARHKALWQRLETDYRLLGAEQPEPYSEQSAIDLYRSRMTESGRLPSPKQPGELNIFWVGASKEQDESGFLQALRLLGQVTCFTNWAGGYGLWLKNEHGVMTVASTWAARLNDASLVEQVRIAHAKQPLDLLMGQMWANYLSPDSLQWIRSQGIPVINVSMDDRLPDNWMRSKGKLLGAVGLSHVVDMVLTTSKDTCAWYWAEKCPAVFWPLASSPALFGNTAFESRDIDVLFIGNKYGYREILIADLARRGIHVECRGAGWEQGPATAAESATLFGRARIILGIGTVGHCEDVYTLKLRDFDATMAGGLYLTHRNPDLTELFEEGVEIVCYESPAECAEKIRYYLGNPTELAAVAASGRRKALQRDTWPKRLASTLTTLGFLNP